MARNGKEWQAIMTDVFGCVPSTTHAFDVRHIAKTYSYKCHCRQHALSTRRHNKILKGMHYKCKQCNGVLELVETLR